MAKPKSTPEQIAARFWRRVDRRGPNDCWPWTGYRDPEGRGQLTISDHQHRRAHRFAWELTCGPIPDGLHVCHHCDNPPCCNPAHLFLGTNDDNRADCVAKGRNSAARGEAKWSAKLTEALVREIRASQESSASIALRLGLATITIQQARNGTYWKHVR